MKYFKNKETKKFLAFSMALAVVTSTMSAGMANAETTKTNSKKLVTPTVKSYVEIATGAAATMTGEAVGVFAQVKGEDANGVSSSAVTISVAANKGYKITSGASFGADSLMVAETGRTYTFTYTDTYTDSNSKKEEKKTVTVTESELYNNLGECLYYSYHETSTIGEKFEFSWTYDDKAKKLVLEYSAGQEDSNGDGKITDDEKWKDSEEEYKEDYGWLIKPATKELEWKDLVLDTDASKSDNEKYNHKYIVPNLEFDGGSYTVDSVTYAVKGKVNVSKDNDYHSTTSNNNGSVSTTAPTQAPTTAPTVAPTQAPTVAPTKAPTESAAPTATVAPTESAAPTVAPTKAPAKTVKVGTKKTVNGGKYKVTKGNKVTYTAPAKKTAKVTIPATVKINGVTCKVTTIGKGAFKGNKKIKSVSLGKNITKIEANAFKGCKNLKTITIKSTSLTKKNVAKTAFKGINKKATFKVPAKKVKAYKTVVKYAGAPKTVKVKK